MKGLAGIISALLLLVSVARCVKVISSAERPEKNGYFTFKNFSLRPLKEFTLCVKLKSYKFGLTDETFYQNKSYLIIHVKLYKKYVCAHRAH